MIKTLCNFFFPKPEVRDVIVIRFTTYSMPLFEAASDMFKWWIRGHYGEPFQGNLVVVLDYGDTYLWRV